MTWTKWLTENFSRAFTGSSIIIDITIDYNQYT